MHFFMINYGTQAHTHIYSRRLISLKVPVEDEIENLCYYSYPLHRNSNKNALLSIVVRTEIRELFIIPIL
jgi:hypothetical protein